MPFIEKLRNFVVLIYKFVMATNRRRTKSDPTGGAYGREAEERTRASAGVEAKVTIGEKRSRWRASPRFRSQSFESVCSDVSTPSR